MMFNKVNKLKLKTLFESLEVFKKNLMFSGDFEAFSELLKLFQCFWSVFRIFEAFLEYLKFFQIFRSFFKPHHSFLRYMYNVLYKKAKIKEPESQFEWWFVFSFPEKTEKKHKIKKNTSPELWNEVNTKKGKS